jgi:hypothetical protein
MSSYLDDFVKQLSRFLVPAIVLPLGATIGLIIAFAPSGAIANPVNPAASENTNTNSAASSSAASSANPISAAFSGTENNISPTLLNYNPSSFMSLTTHEGSKSFSRNGEAAKTGAASVLTIKGFCLETSAGAGFQSTTIGADLGFLGGFNVSLPQAPTFAGGLDEAKPEFLSLLQKQNAAANKAMLLLDRLIPDDEEKAPALTPEKEARLYNGVQGYQGLQNCSKDVKFYFTKVTPTPETTTTTTTIPITPPSGSNPEPVRGLW